MGKGVKPMTEEQVENFTKDLIGHVFQMSADHDLTVPSVVYAIWHWAAAQISTVDEKLMSDICETRTKLGRMEISDDEFSSINAEHFHKFVGLCEARFEKRRH